MDSALPSSVLADSLLSILLGRAGKVLDVQGAIGVRGDASDAALLLNHHGSMVGAYVAYALSSGIVYLLYKTSPPMLDKFFSFYLNEW